MDIRGNGPSATRRTDAALQPFAARPVLTVGGAVAVLLILLSARYGYHRDELYFRAAGQHLAWGYTDQPPITPLLARTGIALFGDTPTGLRILPALMCAATITVTALLARELGAGRAGQLLAAVGAASSALVLAVGHLLSTTTFDLLAWLTLSLLTLRLLRTGDGHWWPAVGAAAGAALLNKDLVLLLAAALLPTIGVVGPRRVLRTWWLAAGLLTAVLIALPNLWWEAAHGWPQLTVAGGISDKDGIENRVMLVPMQFLYLSPVLVPVWLAGFRRLRHDPEVRWARPFAFAYPVLCLLVLAVGGKPYYGLPLLLVLTAAGCEPVVRGLTASRERSAGGRSVAKSSRAPAGSWSGERRKLVVGLAIGAAANLVITLPVLPPSLIPAVGWIYHEQGEQVGWPELVDASATAWSMIPADSRGRAVVYAASYGEAGALARYGPARGLPLPYSGHMSFADWGPPPDSADGPVLIVRPDGYPGVERPFSDCRPVGRVDNGHGVPNEEQHAVVLLCAGPGRPWSALWPQLRHYY